MRNNISGLLEFIIVTCYYAKMDKSWVYSFFIQKLLKVYNTYFLPLCIALTVFLVFFNIGNKAFNIDEITNMLISQSWSNTIHTLYYIEGNMWFHYALIYFWLHFFGDSEIAARSFSALFAIATIPVIYAFGKLLFNKKISSIAILLTTLSAVFIYRAQNVRDYSMLLFFVVCSYYFFAKYIQTSKNVFFILFTVINIVTIYVHLNAFLIIAAQFLTLFLVKNKMPWKKIILAFPILVLASLPLITAPAMHSGQIDWIPRPGIKQLIGTFIFLSNDFLPFAVAAFILFSSYVYFLLKRKKLLATVRSDNNVIIMAWLIIPIILSFVFSLFFKPIYTSTYFNITLIPFIFLLAIAIDNFKKKSIQLIVLSILVLLSIVRLYGWYADNKKLELVFRNHSEELRETSIYLAHNAKSGDGVLFYPTEWQEYTHYYYAKQIQAPKINEINLQPDRFGGGNKFTPFNKQFLLSIPQKHQTLWYVTGNGGDFQSKKYEPDINIMLKNNYTVRRTQYFQIIRIIKYQRQ